MGSLFKGPKQEPIEKPRPVRMPTENDPDVIAASQRTRQAALNRRGRLSTIMTDRVKDITGSTGTKLGA